MLYLLGAVGTSMMACGMLATLPVGHINRSQLRTMRRRALGVLIVSLLLLVCGLLCVFGL